MGDMAAPILKFAPEKRKIRTQGPECARFIENFCVLGEGDYYGEPFILRPWQKDVLNRMLELEWHEPERRWRRKYTRALLGFPTGSGKTPFAAAVGMWFLAGGQHVSPLVAVAAASKEQAGLVFGNAKVMAEESRLLKRFTETGMDSVTLRGQPGRLYRVAASEGTNDGQLPSCLIFDELHEWSDTKNTFNILTKGTAKRRDSFHLMISTAGYDLETICGRLYEHGRAIERGEEEDPRFFFHWIEAPALTEDDDPVEVAIRWHPAAGDFMSVDAIREKYRELGPAAFRRYFLNQWGGSIESWLEDGAWDACREDAEDVVFDPELPVFAAWDGSRNRDSTAVVALQKTEMPQRDADGAIVPEPESGEPVMIPRWKVKTRIWDRPRLQTGKFDENWRVPQKEVQQYIRELCGHHTVTRVGYDPALIALYAEELEDEGLPMVAFPQSAPRMTEATGILEAVIADETLAHDGDAQLSRHISNAVYEPMRTGGGRLVKNRAKNPMDGAIALAMAAWLLQKEEESSDEAGASVYVFGDDEDEDAEEW